MSRDLAGVDLVIGVKGSPSQRRILMLATHNTDIGDGWEREAYAEYST